MARWLSLFAVASLLGLTGCSEKAVPVTGSVTLDGKPVAGASVTFNSDDGKTSYSGMTDEGGNYTLSSGETAGALPGTYKVVVTKFPKMATGTDPSSKEAMDSMKKQMENSKKGGPGAKGGMPGMTLPGAAGATGAKSELPEIYASVEKTPLTGIKVPSDGPVKLELKSKP